MSFFITSLANTELNEDFTVSEYLRITFGKPTFIVNPAQWQTAGTTSTTYVTRLTKPGVVNPSPNEDPVVTDTTSPVITFSDGWTSGTTEILTGGLPTAIVTDDSGETKTPVVTFDEMYPFDVNTTEFYQYLYTATDSSGNAPAGPRTVP